MKKKLTILVLVLAAFVVSAQKTNSFKAGVHTGIPVGQAAKVTSFNLGVDASYTWEVTKVFDLGIASGFTFYTAKDKNKGRDYAFFYIAMAVQYNLYQNFFVAADLGYALGVIEGGWYYQPKIGYTMEHSSLFLSFKGISGSSVLNALLSGNERVSLSSVNLGYTYRFGK
ncbi:hypothetical protein [Elizabethkingia anophelis]|uniref:hypothetical protein n=1 Tax=Elizabethkingia anophelis TaxID=1117645 RepID=UPI000D02574E|nr:hypothetical protein [Elizabethkingia anophelis]MYY49927.1 hypothetical protein [Elizabethkingia anophelis]PRQ84637.1 hypothetical protein CMT87_08985 [Elizabethkingia anophelis]PRQ85859.1 hypothetical protein CMT86_14310 [Elizabethkingia anophelis]